MIVICLKALLDDLEIHQDLGGDSKDVFWWRCSPWSLGRWPRPAASCLILLLPFKIGSQWIPTIRGVYRLGFIKGNIWRGPHHFHYFLIVPTIGFLWKLPIHMNLRKVVGQCRHHEALLSQPATERGTSKIATLWHPGLLHPNWKNHPLHASTMKSLICFITGNLSFMASKNESLYKWVVVNPVFVAENRHGELVTALGPHRSSSDLDLCPNLEDHPSL